MTNISRKLYTGLNSGAVHQPLLRPLAAAIALLISGSTHAATFTVINTNDNNVGGLREAISNANNANGADTIVFDSSIISQTIVLTGGEITISDELTITGPAPGDARGIAIDGNHSSRIFRVPNGIPLTLENLTLTSGAEVGINNPGGAIQSFGSLTLNDTIVTGNKTMGIASGGGGLFGGDITLNRSTVSGNLTNGSDSHGGGLSGGDITINQSTVSGNLTNGSGSRGGGLTGTNITINQSTISNNIVSGNRSNGGGVAASGRVILNQSTISGNSASADGGGVFNNYGSVRLDHSTVTGNSSGSGAGGVYAAHRASITIVTSITIENSVLAGNDGPHGNVSGIAVLLVRNSVFGDLESELNTNISNFNSNINISNVFSNAPDLGVLKNNGGPTQTHLPNVGSPTLDAGDNALNTDSFDQRGRGFSRIVNGKVDIGAVERQQGATSARAIPVFSLPGLLSMMIGLTALVGWRRRSQRSE
jgi:hypothetical protein